MSTHPYIPLYVDDYEAATAHLTIEEDGVYSRLIRLCWRTPGCSLPNDPAWIARKIRLSADDYDRVAKVVIEDLFVIQRGRLVQKRLKAEYDEISRKKSARAAAGKKGGDAKALKKNDSGSSNATDLPPHTRALPKPDPKPEPDKRARARKQDDDLKLEGGTATSPAQAAFDLYNELAARVGGVVHGKMTENWKRSLLARMDGGGLEEWRRALAMVERSTFLCGEARVRPGEAPFKLSLPTLIRPDNYQKLLDGFYGTDREPPAPKEGDDPKTWSRQRWARVMEIYSVSGSWPDNAGPEPGQPGYLGPPTGDDYGHQ